FAARPACRGICGSWHDCFAPKSLQGSSFSELFLITDLRDLTRRFDPRIRNQVRRSKARKLGKLGQKTNGDPRNYEYRRKPEVNHRYRSERFFHCSDFVIPWSFDLRHWVSLFSKVPTRQRPQPRRPNAQPMRPN